MKSHKTKKRIICPLFMAVLILIIINVSLLYFYGHTIVYNKYIPSVNPENIVFQVEQADIENDTLHLLGWCFDTSTKETDTIISTLRAIVADLNRSDVFHFYNGIVGIPSPDVDSYFDNMNHKYAYCGFEIIIDLGSLSYDNDYEIMLQLDKQDDTIVHTGLFLHNKQVMRINPKFANSIEIEGTDLEPIIRQSQVKVYRPEEGIYIYQRDNALYYIIEDYYDLDNGLGRIAFNVFTTMPELLPPDRITYGYESLDWDFSQYEITDKIDSGKYRVAVFLIPQRYPVTTIQTGSWKAGYSWKWKDVIYPGVN